MKVIEDGHLVWTGRLINDMKGRIGELMAVATWTTIDMRGY